MTPTIAYSLHCVVVLLILACLWWFRRDYLRRTRPMLKRGPLPVHVVPLPYHTAPVQTVMCSWCGEYIVEGNSRLVSHGVCNQCLRLKLAELKDEQTARGKC